MSANFTPDKNTITPLKPFRFWCQQVLPLVYDDSLSYYELLCKVVDYLNKTMEDVDLLSEDVTGLYNAYKDLQDYVNEHVTELENFVNNYFDNLDVQAEINHKLDIMADDGTLDALLFQTFHVHVKDWTEQYLSFWLYENVAQETGYVLDNSLTIENAAADAKATGDKIDEINTDLTDMINDVSDTLQDYVDIFTGDLSESVNNWLDAHPEATTTVQDHSLTYNKLVLGTLGFVMPEMYGAAGNGLTDDTEAITDAIASGYPVLLTQKYLITERVTITVPLFGYGEIIENFAAADDFAIVFQDHDSFIEGITFTADGASLGTSILVLKECDNVKIRHCTFNADTGAASARNCLDLNTQNSNITIEDCIFNQVCDMLEGGIWIREATNGETSKNIRVLNSIFNKVGGDEVLAVWGWNGTVNNVVIDNCQFIQKEGTNNPGYLLTMGQTGTTTNIRLTNCLIEAEKITNWLIKRDTNGDVVVNGCKIKVFTAGTSAFFSFFSGATGKMLVENCEITTIGNVNAPFGNYCHIKNCVITGNKNAGGSFAVCDIEDCNITWGRCDFLFGGGAFFKGNVVTLTNALAIAINATYTSDPVPNTIFKDNIITMDSSNASGQNLIKNVSHVITNFIRMTGSYPKLFVNEGRQYTIGNIIQVTGYDPSTGVVITGTHYHTGNMINNVVENFS